MSEDSTFLVVGLDGATLSVAEPMMEAGELPTLSRIAQRGAYGELRSCVPDSTVPSWFSICSGANPGQFGVYLHSHLVRDGDALVRRALDTSEVSLPMIWDILAMEGRSAGAFNVPSMYPAVCAENAFLVSGEPIGGDDWAAPPDRRDHVESVVPGFRELKPTLSSPPAELLETVERKTEQITEYSTRVLETEEPDFFMTVYKGTDTLGHAFWADHDPDHPDHSSDSEWAGTLEEYYRFVDRQLKELLAAAPDDVNVLVISDHGMGAAEGAVALNQWLLEKGYLVLKEESAEDSSGGGGHVAATLDGIGITKERLRSAVKRLPFSETIEQSVPDSVTDSIPEQHPLVIDVSIDWAETVAYSTREGQIHVVDDDTSAVVDRLSDDLEAFAETHGLNLTLYRREDIYSGPFLDRAPHLTVDFEATSIQHRLGFDELYSQGAMNEKRMGIHRPEGLFFAAGPAFENTPRSEGSVYDIAPTVLHAMGVPLSDAMQGSLLDALDIDADPEYVSRERDFERREITGAERQAVEDTLEDLGYL